MRIKLPAIAVFAAISISFLNSCNKEDNTTKLNPYGKENGQLCFYTDYGGDGIRIFLEGEQIGRLDSMLSAPPDCEGDSNVAKYIRHSGTYPFEAISQDGIRHWKGDLKIREGQCAGVSLSDTSRFLIGGPNGICRVKPGADSIPAIETSDEYFYCNLNHLWGTSAHFNNQLILGSTSYPANKLSNLKLRKGRNVLRFKHESSSEPAFNSFSINTTDITLSFGQEAQLLIIRK